MSVAKVFLAIGILVAGVVVGCATSGRSILIEALAVALAAVNGYSKAYSP